MKNTANTDTFLPEKPSGGTTTRTESARTALEKPAVGLVSPMSFIEKTEKPTVFSIGFSVKALNVRYLRESATLLSRYTAKVRTAAAPPKDKLTA
ncbi:MAG: hypothetical protein J6M53_03290 [Bacteroidaceae bacterium]|nr:hypothetical protein [Bacteroidaceae bacterium]